MKSDESQEVVISGLGMSTPLGNSADEVLRRIQAGECAGAASTGFDGALFGCALSAEVKNFEPLRYVSEPKMVRLMNRDAQLAVAAARLALEDSGVKPGSTYPPEDIGLFGATGLAGLPLREVAPLVRASAGLDGEFDPGRFGQAGLKAVSPILSFKILSNMPLCFVSINEGIQGVNGIYTPWEGQGAQAVEAGVRALRAGDAKCALVGACDVKTHELALATLQQLGAPASLPASSPDCRRRRKESLSASSPTAKTPHAISCNGWGVPGEGSAFLVLETKADAQARKARIHASFAAWSIRSHNERDSKPESYSEVLNGLRTIGDLGAIVSSAQGDPAWEAQEREAFAAARIAADVILSPKKHVGNLFAAAGLLQIALGALLAEKLGKRVLASCFGYGSEQAAFLLDPP